MSESIEKKDVVDVNYLAGNYFCKGMLFGAALVVSYEMVRKGERIVRKHFAEKSKKQKDDLEVVDSSESLYTDTQESVGSEE